MVESRAVVWFVASGVVDDDLGGGAAAFKLSLLPGLDVGRGARLAVLGCAAILDL